MMVVKNQKKFNQFMRSISDPDEWRQWTVMVDSSITKTTFEQLQETIQTMPQHTTVSINNDLKHINFTDK